jgi:hypothetical protein
VERLAGSAVACEKVVSEQDLEGFDWKFYLGFYPDLKRSGITNRRKAIRHWLQHGRAEGRIGGRQHRTFRNNFKILSEYLKTVEQRAAEVQAATANREAPLINILTRSNKRPRFFHDNRSSVTGQTYKKFRQLVSYENNQTLKYLKKEGLPETDLIRVVRKQTTATHPYNLFVNDLMDQVAEGWILFLDDDDLFTTPHALSIIASHLIDENSLVVWRAWFPDKNVPSVQDIHQIQTGGITSCCFAFHSKHRENARWHEFKAGDFRCFEQLRKHLKPVFLEDVLARVNYVDCSAGWGEARDKKTRIKPLL